MPIVPFPFKSRSNGDYTNIEDIDVEDIDLVVTTTKPDKQSSVNLFGPKNNVKVCTVIFLGSDNSIFNIIFTSLT